MNILIIENEVYLAQKVVSRLLDDGHNCDFVETYSESLKESYDIVLLSTSLPSLAVKKVIKKYSRSIIILLVSYISDETVTNPIKEGAKDYIMKPFIMDELIRKLYHYKECKEMAEELKTMKNYLQFIFQDIDSSEINLSHNLPVLVESNSQKCSDKLAFDLAKKIRLPIKFISLSCNTWQKELANNINSYNLLYLTDYHTLKKNSKENLCNLIATSNCIICSLEKEDEFPYEKIRFESSQNIMVNNNIMTINDYVKLMVLTFQSKYPDTELSKKLGISRKSLWEKRKKLGIEKKR